MARYCWLSFGPVGTLLQIPILVAFHGEEQCFLLPLFSPSETAASPIVWCGQGASCRMNFTILLLEGQPVLLSSCPRPCPGQEIEVLGEVSKLESHPP